MGPIYLFRNDDDKATELGDSPFPAEKDLQEFFEANLLELTGIEFLGSEIESGSWRGRRIDTLGIDEDGCPVVIEYKRDSGGSIVKQGLDYLDLVLKKEAEVRTLVSETLGHERGREVNVGETWLLCVAGSFSRRDIVAAEYCRRHVELLQYRRFEENFLVLNWVLAPRESHDRERGESESAHDVPQQPRQRLIQPDPTPPVVLEPEPVTVPSTRSPATPLPDFSKVSGWQRASEELRALFLELHEFVLTLSKDVRIVRYESYVASKGNFNILAVFLRPRDGMLHAYASVDPASVELQSGFTRNSEGWPLSHNRLEITIRSREDLERAKPLLHLAYERDLTNEPFRWI